MLIALSADSSLLSFCKGKRISVEFKSFSFFSVRNNGGRPDPFQFFEVNLTLLCPVDILRFRHF